MVSRMTPGPSETLSSPVLAVMGPEALEQRLVAVWPRGLSLEVPLPKAGPLDLGRGPALSDRTISRRHATVEWVAGTLLVTDHDSHNGTFVDGVKVSGSTAPLREVLRLGDVIFVLESGAALEEGSVDPEAIFGRSRAIQSLRRSIHKVAGEAAPVMIHGPTGAGKELVARELHRLSGRKGPLLTVNVAELGSLLVESQLFGHERGAFTGADSKELGLFRSAEGGTLVLDEIGELPLEAQPKLLRVIQEREVRAVGSTRAHRVDVRVIGVTHVDLVAAVESGRFRRDLWARLALFELVVPPLSARRRDLVDWMDRFTLKRAAPAGEPPLLLELTAPAVERLLLDPWPENLRGLGRVVHRAALLDRRPIGLPEVEAWLRRDSAAGPRPASLPPGAPAPADRLTTPMTEQGALSAPAGGSTPPMTGPKPRPPKNREELKAVMTELGGSVRAVAKHYQRDRRQIYRWLDSFNLRGEARDTDD